MFSVPGQGKSAKMNDHDQMYVVIKIESWQDWTLVKGAFGPFPTVDEADEKVGDIIDETPPGFPFCLDLVVAELGTDSDYKPVANYHPTIGWTPT